jgi:transcriptional regulator with XRE-family HTH domain
MARPSTAKLGERARLALGQAISSAREQAGFGRLEDLARVSGVSRKTIGKIEQGDVVSESSVRALEPHLNWTPNTWLRLVQELSSEAAARVRSIDASDRGWAEFRDDEQRRVYLLEKITVTSRELAQAAEELARLELGDRDRPMPTADWVDPLIGLDVAAYRPGTSSYRERLDAAQDEAGETPDAPGPEAGA